MRQTQQIASTDALGRLSREPLDPIQTNRSAGAQAAELRGGNAAKTESPAVAQSDEIVQAYGGQLSTRGAETRQVADQGLRGSGQALPHVEAIQQSFGRHDVQGVRAHVGGQAADATSQLGARAYTAGGQVAFGETPTVHTAAHEAAHVVQQRGGVHLSEGVGRPNDRYERQADRAADQVVQGKSAEPVLDEGTSGGGEGVQFEGDPAKTEEPGTPAKAEGGGDKDKKEEPNPAQNYIDLLGESIGEKVYSELMKVVDQKWLAEEGAKVLKDGSASLEGIKDDIGLDDTSNSALVNFGDVLISAALKAALKWVKSDSGKKFVGKIKGWVAENPEWILTLAILGAAGYVAQTLQKGEFSTKFKISDGLSASIKAKYGTWNVFALKSIDAKVSYAIGKLKIDLEGGHSLEKDETTAKLSGTVGKGNKSATLGAEMDADGNVSGEASGRYGGDEFGLLGKGAYKDGKLQLGLGQYLSYGPLSAELFGTELGGQPAMLYKLGYKTKGLDLSLDLTDTNIDQKLDKVAGELKITPDKLYQLVFKFGLDNAGGKINYTGKNLKASAGVKYDKGQTSASGSVQYTQGGWMAKAMVSGNLTSEQIEKVVIGLGFKGDGAFKQFSIDFARNVTEAGAEDSIKGLFDFRIGDFVLRTQGQASYLEGTGFTKAGGAAYLAAPITSNIKGIAGLKVDYDFLNKETNVLPGAGIQFNGVPLMFHTDFKDKFLFSIAIEF